MRAYEAVRFRAMLISLVSLAVAGCPAPWQPATSPTAAMETYCPRIGMTQAGMYDALDNWSADREAGYSKDQVILFHIGQCDFAGSIAPALEADCNSCVQAIADAVFGPN